MECPFIICSMENQQSEFEQLGFDAGAALRVDRLRRILDFYARPDQEKTRKGKLQLFNMENMHGLCSVLGVGVDRLEFVPEDQLATQLSVFLQSVRRQSYDIGNYVTVEDGKLIILLEGSLCKKSQNHSSMNTTLLMATFIGGKKKRNSNRQLAAKSKESNMITAVPFTKKPSLKKVESGPQLSPKVIYFDFTDPRPYECRTEVLCLQFCSFNLQKLQNWLQMKQKQCLVGFLSTCLGEIDDKKALSKLIPRLNRIRLHNKKEVCIEPETVYFLVKGVVLLRSQRYQMQLNPNCILYKPAEVDLYRATSTSEGLIVACSRSDIFEVLSDSPDVVANIKAKLLNLESERSTIFEKEKQQEKEHLMEPVFSSQLLNFKSFERSLHQYEPQKSSKNSLRNILLKQRPMSNESSKRFRVAQPVLEEITLPADLSVFLGNYPYMKLVESEEKAHSILKRSVPPKGHRRPVKQRQATENEKKKIEKQIKRMFYNDKVRRLKIRNIAEKEIPNGHKKQFNAEKAEQEISEYLLFKNIIEYPVNGVSQDASKEARNKGIIAKLAKMSSVNSKLERKTAGIDSRKNDYSAVEFFALEDSFLELNESGLQTNQPSNSNERTTTLSTEYLKSKNSPLGSFYCKNILNPHLSHLKTQKEIKPKSTRTKARARYHSKENTQVHNQQCNERQEGHKNEREARLKKILTAASQSYIMMSKRMKTMV